MLLHDGVGGADDLVPLAQSLGGDLRLLAPEAPNGHFDGRTQIGHDWFRSDGEVIEPSSFGVSLSLLESFVTAECAEPPFLVGRGHGASLALALLLLAPSLVAGVVAIEGSLPHLRGWGLEPQPLGGKPVLLVGRHEAAGVLREAGAAVTVEEFEGGLRPWLIRTLDSGSAGAG